MFRLIVTGWRYATTARHGPVIAEKLRPIRAQHGAGVLLVHGMCPLGGVDLVADQLAVGWGWHVERHPAQGHPSQDFGRWPECGPRRNRYMCQLGGDFLWAFPGPGRSKGSWGCYRLAGEFGIPRDKHVLAA